MQRLVSDESSVLSLSERTNMLSGISVAKKPQSVVKHWEKAVTKKKHVKSKSCGLGNKDDTHTGLEQWTQFQWLSNPCHYRLTWSIVVWPTTSCFADWSKRRHVTLHIIDCQEVVLTCYRIFITCQDDLLTYRKMSGGLQTCCKYSTNMKSRVRSPPDHKNQT